ncbi:MAG: sortase [Chloroflexi bacterium]|nr:sortase [Chloroflexota bacterium]
MLAGHVALRNIGQGPFYAIGLLRAGDEVRVYTEKNVYTYAVREQQTVQPTDLGVTAATGPPQLTLLTCSGWDAAAHAYTQRLVVMADLVRVEPAAGAGN